MKEIEKTHNNNLILYVTSIVSSLVMLDSNVVAVALPTIARSLNADFSTLQWIITAYVLPFSALLLAAGSWADIYGRKKSLLFGQAIFAIASLICGIATSALMLNIARAFQGLGASMLLTATLAVLNHQFQGLQRAKAFAFWGSCLGIAITCGPVIGGVISSYLGWNWVFLINIPICGVLMFASQKIIPESWSSVSKKLDYPGIILFSIGLLLITWSLIDANELGWYSKAILLRFSIGLILLISFYLVERIQLVPMVDFKILATRKFIGSAFAMLGYSGAAQVMIFYLPFYLQTTYAFAPAKAGLAMLPFALPMFLIPKLTVKLSYYMSSKKMLVVGLLISSTANIFMAFCSSSSISIYVFFIAMIWAGIGAGFLNGETAKVMQSSIPSERAGMGSGISATVRFTGLLFSVAALGALFNQVTGQRFIEIAMTKELPLSSAKFLIKSFFSGDIASIPTATLIQYQESLHNAFNIGFAYMSGSAGIIGFVAMMLLILIYPSQEMDSSGSQDNYLNIASPGE